MHLRDMGVQLLVCNINSVCYALRRLCQQVDSVPAVVLQLPLLVLLLLQFDDFWMGDLSVVRSLHVQFRVEELLVMGIMLYGHPAIIVNELSPDAS